MSIVSNKIPIFCPMCDIMMGTGQDTEFFLTYGVCKDCSIMFAEPRKKKWKEGWRPSEKEIKEYLALPEYQIQIKLPEDLKKE